MSLPLIVRLDAEADIRDACAYLEARRPGLGAKFDTRLAEVFGRIEFMPELFGTAWRDVRAVRFKKFRYVVYYSGVRGSSRSPGGPARFP
jgi:hypothetical protein